MWLRWTCLAECADALKCGKAYFSYDFSLGLELCDGSARWREGWADRSTAEENNEEDVVLIPLQVTSY